MNGSNQKPIAAREKQSRLRAFTVTTLHHGGIDRCAPVPHLRLSGQCLERYGFRSGRRVSVTCEDGRLVLTLAGRATCEIDVDVAPSHSYDYEVGACDTPSN